MYGAGFLSFRIKNKTKFYSPEYTRPTTPIRITDLLLRSLPRSLTSICIRDSDAIFQTAELVSSELSSIVALHGRYPTVPVAQHEIPELKWSVLFTFFKVLHGTKSVQNQVNYIVVILTATRKRNEPLA